ncbi:MAG: NADH-quinone oxidoreductase subunit C [Fimbriimonadaceae bacterium]|nr:NADH-quinone oxidoreductase subunit C [Fimbriimonadaceae bacterium]
MTEPRSAEAQAIVANLPDALISETVKLGSLYLCIERERIADVLALLKSDPGLRYDYFSECVGVDYSEWKEERDLGSRFEVVYNLMSVSSGARVFLKVGADDGEAIPTCMHVFAGAEYPEREVHDLLGIEFQGNGNYPGERFLLPDDWVGYPLRKEFPLGGEDVVFAHGTLGPAVEDIASPLAGESFEGTTGTENVSPQGR